MGWKSRHGEGRSPFGAASSPGRLGRWWTGAARREAFELLDVPGHDAAELAANLRDIRLVNRLGGGTRTVMLHAVPMLQALPVGREVRILDLATGSGDIPRALVSWARRRRRPVHVVASDVSAEILAVAARHLIGYPEITLRRYDALRVPLPDQSVDIVLCSLALHHFAPGDAVALLREMRRLARHGFVLNDIRRSQLGYAAAWLSARVATRNGLTKHDMPLSVLRAYTPAELDDLLRRAGIHDAGVSRHPLFRMAATWRSRGTADAPSEAATQ